MRRQLAALPLTALLLTTCTAAEPGPTAVHVHANGLTLELPASILVRETPGGFLVDPPVRAVRYSHEVTVERLPGADLPAWPDTRTVAGRTCTFQETRSPGGSGGDELHLAIGCPYPGGHVRIAQSNQAEWPGEPDVELAWRVVAGLVAPR